MAFHKSQLEAIQHNQGPAMVLAGPGSGKTTVITHRIRHLIENCHVPPEHILVITFTKAAAQEMEERFYDLSHQSRGLITFGTFHSVFFRMLKYAYRYSGENIVKEGERLQLLEELLSEHYTEIDVDLEICTGILSEISSVKNNRLEVEEFPSAYPQISFPRVYQLYEEALRKHHKVDFDDMLIMTYELLQQRPDILQLWKEKYRYILVDEFQDINQVQYDVIRLLSGPTGNLFVVGDDDQSIYGFRGARPDLMLGFSRHFPSVKRITLQQNYRCGAEIVEAAGHVIGRNQKRFSKKITAAKGRGAEVSARLFDSPQEECRYLTEELELYLASGYQPKDMAILTRTNTGARLLVEYLVEKQIPFRMRDSVPNLFAHWVCRPIFSYISWRMGNHSRAVFLRIMNCPNRYIRRQDIHGEEVSLERLKSEYSKTADRQWMVEKIDFFQYQMTMLGKMKNPFAMVNYIRKGIEYDRFVAEYAEYKHLDKGELMEILDSLQESAKAFDTLEAWYEHIAQVSKKLKENAAKKKTGDTQEITISTLHSAKGLEYPVVYLLDCNETVMPHEKSSVGDMGLEEERRLFYVGMTRAISHLHLYAVKERYGKKVGISRFVKESGVAVEKITRKK